MSVMSEENVALLDDISKKWLLDRGAIIHVCKVRDMYSDLKAHNTVLRVADGKAVYGQRIGKVETTINGKAVTLSNVILCEEIIYNIISIPSITDKGHKVILNHNGGEVIDGHTGVKFPIVKKDKHFWAEQDEYVLQLRGSPRLETA